MRKSPNDRAEGGTGEAILDASEVGVVLVRYAVKQRVVRNRAPKGGARFSRGGGNLDGGACACPWGLIEGRSGICADKARAEWRSY